MKGGTLKQITNTPKAGLKELPSLPDNEEFTVEIISKESGKKYIVSTDTLGSGEGGGGSSELFPNGYEEVNESRDFNSGDANKLLGIKSDDITLSMPSVNPFGKGDLVGIQNINDYKNTHIILKEGNEPILIGDEVFIFDLVDIGGGIYGPQPLTGIISDENGENVKSIIRYLYDQSQNVIPLSGTVSGSPVTGDIEFLEFSNSKLLSNSIDGINSIDLTRNDEGVIIKSEFGDFSSYSELEVKPNIVSIYSTTAGFMGIDCNVDCSPNYTDLSFTQQIYVGFRGTATLSSGTVIVSTDKVKTGYKIYVSVNTPSGTQGFLSAPTGSIVDATSFVINSTNAGDNSTVNWWIAP